MLFQPCLVVLLKFFLCLVHFILTNHLCAESFFFDYRDVLFEG